MDLAGKHIGLAITGSFCTFSKIEQEIKKNLHLLYLEDLEIRI